jgi:hypothetical protein
MNLREYIEKLNKLYTKHGDLELVYSKDDEGNEFNYVNFDPSLVNYNSSDLSVIADDDLDEYNESEYKKVICIN